MYALQYNHIAEWRAGSRLCSQVMLKLLLDRASWDMSHHTCCLTHTAVCPAANHLVKQRYEEKLTQVRAFGREKNLPRSIRTRLVSHYENIYPGAPLYRLTHKCLNVS